MEKYKNCHVTDGIKNLMAWVPSWAAMQGNRVQLKHLDFIDPEKFWAIVKVEPAEVESAHLPTVFKSS